ncbi:hypothetical protein QA601_16960 [Chitinispirillales bacterium ANBcel5]|uniref:hypothetical protein n=1 Tax=Cellulosispirillum alkaliphilum TaxID=3039283 RepID=UPI002A54B8F0|nr:hypothetical protein [Chitinispirillales bacterium ANBcel5]
MNKKSKRVDYQREKVTVDQKTELLLARFGLLLITLFFVVYPSEKLYVYVPTTARPQVIQSQLQEIFDGAEVMVFGRYRDFISRVNSDEPEVVLVKTPLLAQIEYKERISGLRNGNSKQQYVLLSADENFNNNTIDQNTTIGVLDFLGRREMVSFSEVLLNRSTNISRVTRVEDLLPLLTFNMADAVLIEENNIEYFETTSNIEFSVIKTPGPPQGIVAFATKGDASTSGILQAVGNMDKNTSELFGVDSWR